MNELSRIGYSDWFASRADTEKSAAHELARVTSVHKDSYTITRGDGDIFAELAGNLLYATDSAADLPTTGDWVYAYFYDEDSHAIIHGILPRKSLLQRKAAGKRSDYQLIAANIDIAFIIQSLNENFNLRRLERYLVMVNDAGIDPVILLSKSDLASTTEIEPIMQQVEEIAAGTRTMAFSNQSHDNLESIASLLIPGHTYCLLGSSGVGKTSLINSISGVDTLETQTVSKVQSKGKHTTTSRQLIQLDNGALIIDTPGMRELGNIASDDGLDDTFSDILSLAQQCRFANCTHNNEKGCAVRAAIETGELSEQRYQNYLKLKQESAFNQMSYHEKRKKDRAFGKMVKDVMKHKKR